MLNKKYNIILLFTFLLLFVFSKDTRASFIDSLKEKIQDKAQSIKKLEEEIFNYKKQLDTVGTKAKTLQEDLGTLNSAKKKLDGDIKITESDISKTSSTINNIESDIKTKEEKIDQNHSVLERVLRNLQQDENDTLLEMILQEKSMSFYASYIDNAQKIENAISEQIDELSTLKSQLLSSKETAEQKKTNLSIFKKELSGKKTAVLETQKQKDTLLKQTKNEQLAYQKVIAEKTKLKDQFEQEMFKYESELKLNIDQTKLPTIGGGILSWPLDNIRMTQYFGSTVAAKRLYTSGSHNGIDMGASDGTKVKASLSGTVWATGNTDTKASCYSYGKWILIKHLNGLSTLYAHLSSQVVTAGDSVTTGDTIGYSGRTGYVTGPHLHLTVLATEGTRVMTIPAEKTVNCRGVTIPIADPKAYLDPILYLPKI